MPRRENRKDEKINLIFLFISINANAIGVDIEVDPLLFAFDGHSVHIGFSNDNHRLEFGSFALKADEEFHNNENYELEFEGIGVKYDYTFNNYYGFFIGWEFNQGNAKITHTPTNTVFKRKVFTTAPRIGYRFMLSKSFVLTTTLAYDILLEEGDKVEINNESYKNESSQLFPSIHIGYRF